jgi:very-short-patch-repair endonuclease
MLDGMFGCLSTAALVAAGWDSHRIRAAERCCLRRLERGRYLVAARCDNPEHGFVNAIAMAPTTTLPKETSGMRRRAEDLRILVRSYVDRLPPDAVFSHRSALVVHGLPIPFIEAGEVFAESVSPRCGVRLMNMLVRRRSFDGAATEIVDGIPVTTVLQTMMDIARDTPLAFSVAVFDYAVRHSVVTVDEIRSYAEAHPVRTGTQKILRALDNVDDRRESIAESICAMRFVEHSICGFEPQVNISDERGRFLARTDFANEHAKVIAEVDGAGKYHLDGADPQKAFEDERRREYAIRNRGWMVFRIRWNDLFAAEVFLRIREAVRRRLASDESRHRGE